MFALIARRLLWMVPTLFIISLVSFALIQLPPGDYLTPTFQPWRRVARV